MKTNTKAIAAGLALTIAGSVFAPLAAAADQNSKNQWRNLGTGGAALGVYGLATHNSTLGAIGLAGAGYSAYRYEQDRKHQSQQNSARRHYYRHSYSNSNYYTYNGHTYRYNPASGSRTLVR